MSAHDYSARDYAFFSGLASSFGGSPGGNFLGVYEKGIVLSPPPTPTGNRRQPTIYARWGYRYDRQPVATMDPQGYVVRYGELTLTARIEVNGDPGLIQGPSGLWQIWRDHVLAANDGGAVTIFTESPDAELDDGQRTGWVCRTLPLRFILTG